MEPYLWMVDYTPQREWIEKKGLLLPLAFFFTELGAGVYVVSLFFNLWTGCLIGWVLSTLAGGGLHLLYLGKPGRAWRMIRRPRHSELSRGLIFMTLFVVLGAVQLLTAFGSLQFLSEGPGDIYLKVIMIVLGCLNITHGFVTMNVNKALSFWNSSVMPLLSLASGIWIGSQIVIGLAMLAGPKDSLSLMESLSRWSLFTYIFLILYFLWASMHAPLAAQASLKAIIKGRLASLFYICVISIGLVIPLVITLFSLLSNYEPIGFWIYLRAAAAITGDLFFRFCIFKAARYHPLVYSNQTRTPHVSSLQSMAYGLNR